MAVGYESAVVNGQLINVAAGQAYAPLTFGAQYTGPGHWPRNGVYNTPPVMPAPGTTGQGATMATGTTAGNGGGSMPTAGSQNADGSVNWMHPTKSPLCWALGFLAVALLMLHKVHFK